MIIGWSNESQLPGRQIFDDSVAMMVCRSLGKQYEFPKGMNVVFCTLPVDAMRIFVFPIIANRRLHNKTPFSFIISHF